MEREEAILVPRRILPAAFSSCSRAGLQNNPLPFRNPHSEFNFRDIPALHELNRARRGQVIWLMSEQGEAVLAMQHSASLPFVADTEAKQCGVWLIYTATQPNERDSSQKPLRQGPCCCPHDCRHMEKSPLLIRTGVNLWYMCISPQIMKFDLLSMALA